MYYIHKKNANYTIYDRITGGQRTVGENEARKLEIEFEHLTDDRTVLIQVPFIRSLSIGVFPEILNQFPVKGN